MWQIQINNISDKSDLSDNFIGYQLIEKHSNIIYNTIEHLCNKDYKILNNSLEQHIIKYVNNITDKRRELYVYNYGIDKAILLLNDYNNKTNKFINTNTKRLLFIIFYNYFTIRYSKIGYINPYIYKINVINTIIIIQRFWRNVLSYRKILKSETINKDITYLIEKINNEITGEPAKKVLIYLVNKFRKRLTNII